MTTARTRAPVRTAWLLGSVLLGLLPACTPPDPRTADGTPDGARLYGLHCEGCHGPDGRKGEPGARLAEARGDEAELRAAIENGRGTMPS